MDSARHVVIWGMKLEIEMAFTMVKRKVNLRIQIVGITQGVEHLRIDLQQEQMQQGTTGIGHPTDG